MPIYRIAIGTPAEASHPESMKAGLAEFFSMIIFVFAGQGSGIAFSKLLIYILYMPKDFSTLIIYIAAIFVSLLRDTRTFFCTDKVTKNGPSTPSGLVAASLGHAFALMVAISVGANISGGHVNPAVTFGAFIGGNITLLRAIVYWIGQLLGSIVACWLLKIATGGMVRIKQLHS